MCISSLGGFRKEYRQQIPLPERAERAAHVTDTLLLASREVTSSQQDRRLPRARSQLPASHPSPSTGPSAQALPRLGCCAGISPGCSPGTQGQQSWSVPGKGRLQKHGLVQLGLQYREERIYTLEYNVRTNLGLQQSVLTAAYCNGISETGFSL